VRERIRAELPHFNLAAGMHRWQFDPSGRRLVYFRDGHPIVRELATGAETELAPAWSASWTAGGEWLVVERVAGDTNHDGFVHGPNQMPIEPGPYTSCGTHFDYGNGAGDLGIEFERYLALPDDERERIDRAVEDPDELTRTLWRVGDRLEIEAVAAIDRETVVTRSASGALAIGMPRGHTVELAPANCEAEIVHTYRDAIVYTCGVDTEHVEMRWYRNGARASLGRGHPGDLTMICDDCRAALIATAKLHRIVDLTTGRELARGNAFPLWSDATRSLIGRPGSVELRSGDGRVHVLPGPATVQLPDVAGHYLVYDDVRLDLATGEAKRLRRRPLAIRSDGAILVDGGAQTTGPIEVTRDHRGLRIGPLRWIGP
jgi:hypothetical protein